MHDNMLAAKQTRLDLQVCSVSAAIRRGADHPLRPVATCISIAETGGPGGTEPVARGFPLGGRQPMTGRLMSAFVATLLMAVPGCVAASAQSLTEAQLRRAINIVEAARAQTLAVETAVSQAVAQAYLDVVRDQDLLAVNRNNEYVLRQEIRIDPNSRGDRRADRH
jgi:hypothetical protein